MCSDCFRVVDPTQAVDPRITAGDLRNAALVLEHGGWTTGAYVSPRGSTCLEGAVRLATTSALGYGVAALPPLILGGVLQQGFFELEMSDSIPDDQLSEASVWYARRHAALVALGEHLPDTCSAPSHKIADANGDLVSVCAGLSGCDKNSLRWQYMRVHHFNDYECDGGSEASAVLIEVAEKLEANA